MPTIRCDGAAIREILPRHSLEALGGELFAVSPSKNCRRMQPWPATDYIRLDATRAVVGSTYRRDGQSIDVAPWDHLHRRLESWLPSLRDTSTAMVWRTTDHCGRSKANHWPFTVQTFICTGFASKGSIGHLMQPRPSPRILQQEISPRQFLRRFS